VLAGEASEDDGTLLKAGDWIVYEPGTRHSTRTLTGCLLLGVDWDPPDSASPPGRILARREGNPTAQRSVPRRTTRATSK
jgi:hypothetical protein